MVGDLQGEGRLTGRRPAAYHHIVPPVEIGLFVQLAKPRGDIGLGGLLRLEKPVYTFCRRDLCVAYCAGEPGS